MQIARGVTRLSGARREARSNWSLTQGGSIDLSALLRSFDRDFVGYYVIVYTVPVQSVKTRNTTHEANGWLKSHRVATREKLIRVSDSLDVHWNDMIENIRKARA